VRAQLRGALRGCTLPTQLAALRKGLDGLGGTLPPAQMVTTLVEELAAEGAVFGQLKGGATSWVPAAHTQRQRAGIAAFFQQNGCVGCACEHCLRSKPTAPEIHSPTA
jgi:hypothetical protein